MHLKPGPELEKARREIAEYERFRSLTGQVAEVNEAICQGRPVVPGDADGDASPAPGGEKGGSGTLAQEKAAELGRLAAAAARALGGPAHRLPEAGPWEAICNSASAQTRTA